VRAALARVRTAIERAGHTVRDVDLPEARLTPDVYLHIVLPEATRYHSTTLASQASGYSPGVRLRLEMGRYVLAEDYVRAMGLRTVLRAGVERALEGCDGLLLPALSIPAPPLGAPTIDIDGTPEPTRGAMLRMTQLFNLSGHPTIAVPSGTTPEGLPLSMQLVGRRDQTHRLLDLAQTLEAQITGGAGSVGGGTG
jgi:aspartyl-tRNA(Asn)/glutamyl-tRNA(Gln) amidotransferase subunit A